MKWDIVLSFLQQYLRIDTSYPNLAYDDALALFKQQAEQDGFSWQEVMLPSGFKVLIISWPGTDATKKSLVLNHHMDVVPIADRSAWKYDPFGATIENDIIYGRGTQDMKAVGVAHYFAMKRVKDEGFKPERTIHLVALPEEERGGFAGAAQFIEHPVYAALNVGFVLDEGVPSGAPDVIKIKVSERKPMQMQLVSKGTMAHGSLLRIKNAAHELVKCLHELVILQERQRQRVATEDAGLLLSVNITSLQAGVMKNGVIALNVVGDTASATIDLRVPPGVLLTDVEDELRTSLACYPSISYKILAKGNDIPYVDYQSNEFYQKLVEAVGAQGLRAQPFHAEESSDLRFYLTKGVTAFGLTPFTVHSNLHGIDECITLHDLEQGFNIFCNFLKRFCCK